MPITLDGGTGITTPAVNTITDLVGTTNIQTLRNKTLIDPVLIGETTVVAVDTNFFPSTTLVTAIIYDTADDYQGGAWRKKCQDKSWFTETIYGRYLGTATNEAAARAISGATTNDYYYDTTAALFRALNAGSGVTTVYRGNRREFPARSIITVETARVVIWDIDYGTPRMWMVFVTSAMLSGGQNRTCVASLNGAIAVGASDGSTNGNCVLFSLLQDSATLYAGSKYAIYNTIANRNISAVLGSAVSPSIVNARTNAIAITTLPNAPLDEYGMPKPTIAVGTDGGVSVITQDGAVVNHSTGSEFSRVRQVGIVGDDLFLHREHGSGTGYAHHAVIPKYATATATNGYSYSESSTWPAGTKYTFPYIPQTANTIKGLKHTKHGVVISAGHSSFSTRRLCVLRDNPASPALGMISYLTKDYISGHLVGDIRRAWLADGTAETITGSGELVTNGTFDTDTSGWTAGANSSIAVASGKLRVTASAGGTGAVAYSSTFPTIVGKSYVVRVTHTEGVNSGNAFFSAVTAAYANITQLNLGSTSGEYAFTFVATTTESRLSAAGATAWLAGEYSDFDNISVKLAEPDRCSKNKGITIVGSLTKSAVATGADLVAYSGFSAANYLEEAYSSELDFGTGDFCIKIHVRPNSLGADVAILHRAITSGGIFIEQRSSTGYLRVYATASTSFTAVLTTTIGVTVSTWNSIVISRSSGTLSVFINNQLAGSASLTTDLSYTNSKIRLGDRLDTTGYSYAGSLCLCSIGATAPTAQQIADIYQRELPLFQTNAAFKLAGSSDAILAVDHDQTTDTTHVLTSFGRSSYRGCVRVASEATSVGTPKAVASGSGVVVQIGSTSADVYIPPRNLREETDVEDGTLVQLFDYDATASQTIFPLPQGWKPTAVWAAGSKKREGSTKDYTLSYDGYIWSVVFGTGLSVSTWVQIQGEQQ